MEVKAHLITSMGLGTTDVQGGQEGKLRAERVAALQERKQALEALLSSRVGELKHLCLQEAELTGRLPRAFPLATGENVPEVQRRPGLALLTKADDENSRRQMKALFSGTLYRHADLERGGPASKRTVHRGCHTEDTMMSESTSSMSDSTSHDNESSPSVAGEQRSLSQPRMTVGSPDQRAGGRRMSPVEIYYEMRTRRNSASSSVSPSHSLPRSSSNTEGRSVPATPLLARTAPISVHVRAELSGGGGALKQWSGSLDQPHVIPLALEGPDRRGGSYGSRARRSNSSEALLDRSGLPGEQAGGPPPPPALPPRNGMPAMRGGPYRSSEALTDGKLRRVRPGSPEGPAAPEEQAKLRLSMGGRVPGAGPGAGPGYSELLMDYIWGKQQQQQRVQAPPPHPLLWQDSTASSSSSPRSSTAPAPPPTLPPPAHHHANGFSLSQVHLPSAAPPYSPLVLRGSQAESRRVKVTRTKSCGPFIPLQDTAPPPPTSSAPLGLLLHAPPLPPPALSRRTPPQVSVPGPEDAARSLHKALALEGLRDWYLRNALGYPPLTPAQGHLEAGVSRLSHPHPLVHQAQSAPGDALNLQRPQMAQSASFHGHPLLGRTMEFSLYQEPSHPQMQEVSSKEPSADPGTLV